MKNALVIRHLNFEDLGTLEQPLIQRNYNIHIIDATSEELQAVDPITPDLMVILGGPIGAYDEKKYPFIENEIALINARLQSNKKTLGICLGAQLIARVLGASVYPMGHLEIGFSPLQLSNDAPPSCLDLLNDDVAVLHWHGDQFDIPKGAHHLASSKLCANQAFSVGKNILGLQFHLEIDPDRFEQWLIGHAAELNMASIDPRDLRRQIALHGKSLKTVAPKIISNWLDLPL
ncbi:glutamine amidotransferase [Pseudomonas fluorescens]|uniref:glutamine amidotransferase n=1 Tax=Pseudomonas TaxID=286 RepID=UPI00070F7AB1|nr:MULTISPECIES: glutamine amidotransferase [Pseudomonas]OOQ44113.1 glutamine amidotransferase [Pseudomonas fluorescens]